MDEFEQLDHNLTNHPPVNDLTVAQYEEVRSWAKGFGEIVLYLCPPSRERALALTRLEEAVMWAVASIARNQIVRNQ